jgi:hypothetical protein
MTITADGAVGSGWLRAGRDTRSAALTPPLVVPLRALGARSGARAPAGTRAGVRSEALLRGRDARLMMLQRSLWSFLCDRYFRLEVSGWERLPAEPSLLVGVHLPIMLGVPLGVSLEILPTHFPLPAKIRTELLDPIEVEHDPERAGDVEYVDRIYREVQAAFQAGMNRLGLRRRFPVFG